MKERRILEVKYGSIYNKDGYMIDNMAIIFIKGTGIYKYGESRDVEKTYGEMVEKYGKAGLEDILEDTMLIKFDKYGSELSIEEVCTLVNYMLMVSANAEKNLRMLNMDKEELKEEIKRLQEIGF